MFRGDYVSVSYSLTGTYDTATYSGDLSSVRYIVPAFSGGTISGIARFSVDVPTDPMYIQVQRIWADSGRNIYVRGTDSKQYVYNDRNCTYDYVQDKKVNWYDYGGAESTNTSISYLNDNYSTEDNPNYRNGTLVRADVCTGNFRFTTTATDRYFVPEDTGLALEDKLRNESMYAKWAVGNKGVVVLLDILPQSQIPKK
jgi:uncharacterized membrane-anchored protein